MCADVLLSCFISGDQYGRIGCVCLTLHRRRLCCPPAPLCTVWYCPPVTGHVPTVDCRVSRVACACYPPLPQPAASTTDRQAHRLAAIVPSPVSLTPRPVRPSLTVRAVYHPSNPAPPPRAAPGQSAGPLLERGRPVVRGAHLGRAHSRRGHPQSLPGGQLAGAGPLV